MIGVLIVDDDPVSRDLHRAYLERIDGFDVVAEAAGARTALAKLFEPRLRDRIDLILLDMSMPDGSGLDVLRKIRSRRLTTDVIPVTGVRDAETVRRVLALGAVHYLVKPFTFAVFRERMEQYRRYRRRLTAGPDAPTQSDIDAVFGALRPGRRGEELPKGLSPDSLERVRRAVAERGALTATEAAELIGMSRVTTRRYLEYLERIRAVERVSRYGTGGRPISEYRWLE